jgi:hypothetical protein
LENEQDPVARRWLLQQLANAETEVLNILRADRERLERENRNMEAALEKIRMVSFFTVLLSGYWPTPPVVKIFCGIIAL